MSDGVKAGFKKVFKMTARATKTVGRGVSSAAETVASATAEKVNAAAGAVNTAADRVGAAAEKAAGTVQEATVERSLHNAVAKANKRWAELEQVIVLMGDVGIDQATIDAAEDSSLAWADAIAKLAQRTNDIEATTKQFVETLIPNLVAETKKYRTMAKEKPLSVASASGQNVTVFWTDIPGFTDLDKTQRAALAQAVATKIEAGKQLYQSIKAGNAANLPAPSLKDVTNLVWAFKSAAQEKKSAYEKGALTVPNGIALRDYLDRCTDEVYPRISSHLPEHAQKSGQSARGMDFYDADPATDPDRLLPSGMNTLLYQMVTTPEGNDKLYVKMETEGMRLSGGDNHKTDPTAPEPRPLRKADVQNSTLHGYNWLKVKLGKHTQDKDLKAYREDAPEELEEKAKALVKAAPKPYRAQLKLALGEFLRINFFMKALSELNLESVSPFDDAFDADFDTAVADFVTAVNATYGVGTHDDTFGDEVALDANLA